MLGNPTCGRRSPYAMAWPERIAAGVEPLDLFSVARLDFHEPDLARFRCLQLAYDALKAGGTAPAILNAANEIAVAAFLDRRLPFLGIARLNEAVLDALPAGPEGSLDDVLGADAEARRLAGQMVAERRFA
jgi:1-deoxy-D-xylulose-5-phosphate reductoisomerase